MALIIAGERSGVGKTTVTLALLTWLVRQQISVQSFKVGPDYIDPMFHQAVTGRPCRNLDPVLTSEHYVQQCFARHTETVTHALIEGVMGLFDGAVGMVDFASTAHIARLLNLPVVLVLDCSRLSHSIAALVHGYRSFDPRIQLAGVVLNRVGSDRHLALLQAALQPLQVPILGVLRRQDGITIPDRHLGLVPTTELNHLSTLLDQLGHLAETSFDWNQLLPLLEQSRLTTRPETLPADTPILARPLYQPRIAIAQDAAFSFYYADNLELLEALGAELVPWSPLRDTRLPDGVQGLYFGGGFPEVFAEELSENPSIRQAVQTAVLDGMPTYAECGGLMYLSQAITTFAGQTVPMVGVLPTTAVMGSRLTLGYRRAIAQQDSSLVVQGQTIWGHEFHRSALTELPQEPLFQLQSGLAKTLTAKPEDNPTPFANPVPLSAQAFQPDTEGWQLHQLHASYIHLHWGSCPALPARFLSHCQKFSAADRRPSSS